MSSNTHQTLIARINKIMQQGQLTKTRSRTGKLNGTNFTPQAQKVVNLFGTIRGHLENKNSSINTILTKEYGTYANKTSLANNANKQAVKKFGTTRLEILGGIITMYEQLPTNSSINKNAVDKLAKNAAEKAKAEAARKAEEARIAAEQAARNAEEQAARNAEQARIAAEQAARTAAEKAKAEAETEQARNLNQALFGLLQHLTNNSAKNPSPSSNIAVGSNTTPPKPSNKPVRKTNTNIQVQQAINKFLKQPYPDYTNKGLIKLWEGLNLNLDKNLPIMKTKLEAQYLNRPRPDTTLRKKMNHLRTKLANLDGLTSRLKILKNQSLKA